MLSGRYPGATWRPVNNHGGPMTDQLGLVLHVQEGDGSVYGEFSDPASNASYHFWISQTGQVEQYIDLSLESWAQIDGNPTYWSVGTEGFSADPLTDAQVSALAALCKWLHDNGGLVLVEVEVPGERGLGWHGMGCNYNWGHCVCPGVPRREQRAQALAEAQGNPVPPAPAPAPTNTQPVLSEGATGPEVVQVQMLLNRDINAGLATDGQFGPATKAAVERFQTQKGLSVDGVVGPQTWSALIGAQPTPSPTPAPAPAPSDPTLSQGATGVAVSQLQTLLNQEEGAGLAVDGDFGPATLAAVRAYQTSRGLTADGVVGPLTWDALRSGKGPVVPPAPAPAPVPAPAPAPGDPTLGVGATGAAVVELQDLLNQDINAGLVTDGDFGPATLGAVRSFQASRGLSVDGVVGPQTWAALRSHQAPVAPPAPAPAPAPVAEPTLAVGASGAAVVTLQQDLNRFGAGLATDGQFGPATLAAVRNFQSAHHLSVDGVVGPQTWGALRGASVVLHTRVLVPENGMLDGPTVAALQAALGVSETAAGRPVFGTQTRTALQVRVGVTATGEIDASTIEGLQRLVGTVVNGTWTPSLTRALQHALNEGTL